MFKAKLFPNYGIKIESVREIELNNRKIVSLEDNLFHKAIFLSKLNLRGNFITKLLDNMFNCGECFCLNQLKELDLSGNPIIEINHLQK